MQLANKLIKNDKVVAIIGPSTTGETMAVIPVAEKEQIPLISCAAGIKITDPVKNWVFKTPANDHVAAEKILNSCRQRKAEEYRSADRLRRIRLFRPGAAEGSGREKRLHHRCRRGLRSRKIPT